MCSFYRIWFATKKIIFRYVENLYKELDLKVKKNKLVFLKKILRFVHTARHSSWKRR